MTRKSKPKQTCNICMKQVSKANLVTLSCECSKSLTLCIICASRCQNDNNIGLHSSSSSMANLILLCPCCRKLVEASDMLTLKELKELLVSSEPKAKRVRLFKQLFSSSDRCKAHQGFCDQIGPDLVSNMLDTGICHGCKYLCIWNPGLETLQKLFERHPKYMIAYFRTLIANDDIDQICHFWNKHHQDFQTVAIASELYLPECIVLQNMQMINSDYYARFFHKHDDIIIKHCIQKHSEIFQNSNCFPKLEKLVVRSRDAEIVKFAIHVNGFDKYVKERLIQSKTDNIYPLLKRTLCVLKIRGSEILSSESTKTNFIRCIKNIQKNYPFLYLWVKNINLRSVVDEPDYRFFVNSPYLIQSLESLVLVDDSLLSDHLKPIETLLYAFKHAWIRFSTFTELMNKCYMFSKRQIDRLMLECLRVRFKEEQNQ